MADDLTQSGAEPQLLKNSLGLSELVFQGITHIAPAANIIFTFPIIALQAGPAMPLSFLLSTVVCFFIGNTVSQFSRYMPSSGGYYSFATRGLGSRSGFMATWSYLIYEILGAAGGTGFLGYLVSDMLQKQFHVNIPWWSLALAITAVIWALTHHGIQLSARMTAILGGLELLIMLALAITFVIHPGPGSSYVAPLKPSSAPHHVGGILAGMVFSILALSGFEAPAPLAQEARRPGKFISQAIMLSLVASESSTSSLRMQVQSAGARATWRPSPPTRIRIMFLAAHCGVPAGGWSSSPSSTVPLESVLPAPMLHPV